MELERLNMEEEPETWREEERNEEEKSTCPWVKCSSLHNTVSKWMLPGEARATYLERASCVPPPIFILAISLAELSVFIYYAIWKPQIQWITLEVGIWESPLIYRPEKRKEAWRFLSYMFLHAGVEHIIGNLVLQLCLGIPLELVHKGHRVGTVYLAGVIGGSLASSICDPLLGLVGASGGVYALIGGYFMNILVRIRAQKNLKRSKKVITTGSATTPSSSPPGGQRSIQMMLQQEKEKGVTLEMIMQGIQKLQVRAENIEKTTETIEKRTENMDQKATETDGKIDSLQQMTIKYEDRLKN